MFVQYLVAFHFLCATLYGAPPPPTKQRQEIPPPIAIPPTVSKNGQLLPNISSSKPSQGSINYEARGRGFEGDMLFPNGFKPSEVTKFRGVALAENLRWPDGIIPYDISAITSSSHQKIIVNAMNTLMYAVATPIRGKTNRESCVYFRPKVATDRTFVKVVYGDSCSATVGYWAGSSLKLNLDKSGCFDSGTIQHELMHVLGFDHEQSRPDRDSYVTVLHKNIDPSAKENFEKYSWITDALNLKTSYDYASLMHYGSEYFSKNGQPTIVPTTSGVKLGQRDQLSLIDIKEIRSYYRC